MMKVRKIIAFVMCLIFAIPNLGWAASDSKTLQIKVKIKSKSKLGLDRSDITLSDDPEENAAILTEPVNVISKTRTGGVNQTSLEASTDLVSTNGDVIPLTTTVATTTNTITEISWQKVDSNLFQGDIWDTLVMNLDYKNHTVGPYAAVVKYTLITP
jgi:hypothetical protein